MIKEKINELLEEVLNVEVSDKCNLINEGLNSVKISQLIIKIEEAFGVDFQYENIDKRRFITLQSIVDFVCEKIDEES